MNIEIYIPLVVGLTEVAKRAYFPSRFVPLLSIILGGLIATYLQQDLLQGVILGLSAQGLYSGIKKTVGR